MLYAASDLHGQWDKYQELVKRLALNDGENELYLLGDLIDRGPGSCKILLDIRKRDNIHALFGNHEYMAAMCLSWVLKEITKDSIDDLTELQMATLDEWISRFSRRRSVFHLYAPASFRYDGLVLEVIRH